MPVPGYGKDSMTNTMRLWSVKSPKDFDLGYCKCLCKSYLFFNVLFLETYFTIITF